MLLRENYMAKLAALRERPTLKLITGLRGSGKSHLFAAFRERLRLQGLGEEQLILINFDDLRYGETLDFGALHQYLEGNLAEGLETFLFLDELTGAVAFEAMVGRLYLDRRLHIYIAASNLSILAGDMATIFSGGYDHLPLFPLSFREWSEKNGEEDFSRYLQWGGLPGVLSFDKAESAARDYLEGIFYRVLGQEILERYPLRDFPLLKEILAFAGNARQLLSPASVAASLKQKNPARSLSVHTVTDYLSASVMAGLLYRMDRRDITTGKILSGGGKYFWADMGLRSLLLPKADMDDPAAMENLVFLELRQRGLKVTGGRIGAKNVDFVTETEKDRKRSYLQVARKDNLPLKLKALREIRDQYPKYIVTLEDDEPADYEGIAALPVRKFLEGHQGGL